MEHKGKSIHRMTLPLQVIGKPSIRASQITTDQSAIFGERASRSVQWLAPRFKCAELRTVATRGTHRRQSCELAVALQFISLLCPGRGESKH
jgi:hypothetical protein